MDGLEEHFGRLSETLTSWGVPSWENVLFSENLQVDPFSIQTIKRSELYGLVEFSDRFEALLNEGHNWINLSGLGVLDNTLIVAIEKPKSNSGSPLTSVNQSGPPNCVKDTNYNLEKFIEIEK